MSEELFTYSEVQNLGFFTNPNLQDSKLKAMNRREQLMQGAYYYANSDRDDACRNKSAEIFGGGTIPLSDKENSAYFLGHAVLLEHGYTGSPFQYFLQQKMDLPPEVTDEETARIYIGNDIIKKMRAAYDKNKQDETILANVQNNLSGFLAPLVRMPSGYQGQPTDKDVADALNRMGVWDKISPSVDRARIAWLRMQHLLQDVDHMQEAGRPELAELADVLSDDKGQLDEMAVLAFYSAVEQHAKEKQSDDSQFWATFSNSFENFIDRAIDEDAKERAAQIAGGEAYQQAIKAGATEEQAMQAAEAAAKATGYNDHRVERMRGIMQSAMHTAMEPSEQASMFAKIGTGSGRLFGDSIIPMAGAIAAVALTKGRGVGLIGQAAAGWAGGFAVSKDSIINQAVAQAYLEGVENPEEYGYYAGLGQAAAENIAGVGTSGFMAFKGINRLMTKAAAKATTSKVLSNAYARATLAWAATTGIEGTTELAEEEIGEALGSMLNAMARATGSDVSEQKYEPLKAIKQMKPHQIASMYVFAGALGLGGAAANFAAAQEMSLDIGKLKAVGYSDKKAREVQAHGIVTARKIEEVSNSNATAEEKKAQITAIQDERLEYLGKTFREDVANASNEELVTRSKEENAEFTYRSLLAWAIQNQLDEQALIDLGYMSAKRQPNGNYLLTYEEKGEGENAQPKFVQKEWNRDQLHGFMTFQRGTDVHMKLRELSGQLMAMQFAEKVASVEELKIQLANLRDTPITELATIMQHEAITPELFKAFAEKEVANIEADMRDKGMTWTEAEKELSKLLPGVTRKAVIQTAKAAEERKQNAIAKDEIKPGQPVEYPGLNISRFDGTTLVAFFNQKITLSQMLEEMMEARLNQQAKNDPELYNKLGTILQGIQNKLKGVQILPKGKTSFSRGDIVEAYSHLAVAEVIANPAYISHLSQREQAVVQDVLGSVFRAQRYKAIAGAWLNYKESAEGKAYLENGGKDLVDIFSEAGFTFGKHLEAKQATEEQKMKALEARNFLPDFNEETKLLENKAEAEQKLAEVNAKEAQEPTIIPADESVTGEEIVITPEQKEAEQIPTSARPDIVQLIQEKSQLKKDIAFYEKAITESRKKISDYRIKHSETQRKAEKLKKLYNKIDWESEEEKAYRMGEIESKKELAASYLTDIALEEARIKETQEKLPALYERFRVLTGIESVAKLQSALATARDFAIYFSNFPESDRPTRATEFGLYTTTQNGESNPAYTQGLLLSKFLRPEEIESFSDEQLQETIKHALVDEAIYETTGTYTTAERTKENVSYKKKQLKDAQIEEKLIREKAERVVASLSGNTGALPKAPQWTGISEARYNKQTDEERAAGVVKALKTTASKDPTRKVINHVYHQIKGGKEYWVSTDGVRMTVVSRDTNAPDTENFYEAKSGKEVSPNEAGGKYVNFLQVIPNRIRHEAKIDFAPYRALKNYKKAEGHLNIPDTKDPRVIYQPTEEGRNYKPIKLNTVLFRDAVDQLASLAKVLNFNSEVTVGYVYEDSPLVFTAQQNGWEWKHVIMLQSRADETLPGDISLSNKPQFIGATQHNEQQRNKVMAELKKAEEKTAELKTQVKEMEARYKMVSELEKSLSEEEKHARWFAAKLGQYPRSFHRARVKEIINKNLTDSLMEALTWSHTQNKWTSALFTRITGIKLPGTIKGNEAVIKEWAPKEYAEYIKRQETSPNSSTSDTNFSIQEAADKGMFQNGVLHTDNAIVTEPNFSIQAMHVSPHEFYKFSTDFIGTGEGSQAYGWGVYAMTHWGINETYHNLFNKRKGYSEVLTFRGEEISREQIKEKIEIVLRETEQEYIRNQEKHKNYEPFENLIDSAEEWLHWFNGLKSFEAIHDVLLAQYKRRGLDVSSILTQSGAVIKTAEALRNAFQTKKKGSSINYKLEINADDTNLLLWDTRLDRNKVTPAIREILDTTLTRFAEIEFNDFYEFTRREFSLWNTTLDDISEDLDIDGEESMPREEMKRILNEGFVDNHRRLVKAKKELDKAYIKNDKEDIEYWKDERKRYSKEERAYKSMLDILDGEMRGEAFYRHLSYKLGSDKAASLWLAENGYKGIKFLDAASRDEGEGTYNYVIFSGDDIKITAINKSGKWSMTEGWEEYNDPTANFSIQAASLPDRFAGHPLAERMSNFMRTEARRYERTLSKQTPGDAATNALFATQSIIHAVDKYVRNGEFKLPRESMVRLKHARALIDKYAQMMKSGKVRSFNKIDKAEQAELLAAMAEAAAGIDADAINAMTPEEYAALKAEVEAEMKPELYRKHARALADDVAKGSYSTPAEITKRMKALAQAAKTGFTNQGLTDEDLQKSGYNSQPDASTRQTVLKEYAKAKLAELEQAEEANRKEFEDGKAQTLSALHRIMSEGRIADNTTLGEAEQRQLTELVENEAQDTIEKEARNREFKLTGDKIQQDAKERNERMVRVAATGRIGELLRDMLNETADIVDLYLKTELLKKLKRITDSVKIKRSPSKTLKGKMGAAEYRRMDAIVELMEMSARAKDNALGEIENARRILNESKGEIPEVAVGSLLWDIINNLNEQGITVSVDTLNIELNNREADINVFANLDGMDYAEALNAARGLAGLIYFGRTAWQMKQAEEYERIKAFLDYFYEHTDSELGTSQAIDKGKKKKLGNIFNSSMNDAQLLFALAGHEGLRPVMDEMRRKLAMAQDARNLHIKSITNQIYATYARLIGMRPQTEAGYTDKQLREASNKFSMEFEKWNETGKPNVVREWIDNDGVLKKQEMELSRLQALDLILTYRQQHYQPNADKHGYTEAVLNKLEEYCGTRLMAMGEAFKRTIQNDGTAQVYEERTGIPMYKDPSYWPGSININTINLTSEEPLVNPYNPAGTYNRLKQRVKNTNEAKYQNAFEKWKHAIAEGANYIYLYPITNTLNRMLAHREFANRLHGLIGSDLFSQLRLMLNVLDSSTWQETALRDEANNWAASMLKATAPAVLALNPGTLARQLSAINNYAMLPGIRISRLPALIALIKQDKSAIKLSDIMQLDSFRARYRDNAEVNDMLGLGPNAKFSAYNKWAKAGMNIIDRLDIWSNAVSACLYYNMLYEQMQEKNQDAANPLSEEEIRNICEQNVTQLLRLVAQPLEKANKSAMYWKYGNTWMGSIFLYMSTEMVNKTGMLRATYIKNKAEGMPFYKNAWQLMYKMGLGLGGMTFLIEAALFLLLSGDLPDDEKEWLAALFSLAIYSAFGQYLSRIPFIGSVTDYYLSPYGQYATSKSQQQNPALSIDKTSAKLLKMMSDNKHYSASEWQVAYTRFVRDLTAVSGVASGLVPQAQWISTTTATLQSLSAAMNTVYPVARSVQTDSWMRNITPDWYKPKKTKKRTKSALEEALTPEPEKKKGKKSK